MKTNFSARQGVVEQQMRDLVCAKAPRKNVAIGLIGIGFELHFDWAKAKQSFAQAQQDVKGVFTDSHTLLAEEEPVQTKEQLLALLNQYKAQGAEGLIIYQASYIAGDLALALATWLRQNQMPLLSWSHTEVTGGNLTANRLCGQNFLLNILSSMEVKYSWLFREPGEASLAEDLGRFVRVVSARARLEHGKILMVGGMRVPGFYDCELNEMSIAKHFGLAVDRIDLATVFQHGEKFSDEQLAPIVASLVAAPSVESCKVSEKELLLSVRLAASIADYAFENNFIGLALKNWPELFDIYGIAGDGAGSLVQDLGLPVADESDMGALLTMVTFNELSEGDTLPTLMDLSYLNAEEDKLGMWHCGGTSTKLMREGNQLAIRNHSILDNYDPEQSYGMLFEFMQELGDVTIAKYQYPHASTIFAFEGEIVDSPMRYRGCYGEVAPKGVAAQAVVGSVMSHGMDHHWIMARGHVLEDLREFNHWAEVNELSLEQAQNSGRSIAKKLDY